MLINGLNLKLQGEHSIIFYVYLLVKAFRKTLTLFEKNLATMNYDHYETCMRWFSAQNNSIFSKDYVLGIIFKLGQEFENPLAGFDFA